MRHPQYNISRGAGQTQFVINDIAAVIVEDMNKDFFDNYSIYPACLPKQGLAKEDSSVIHSGWSAPPPVQYLWRFAPPYLPFYKDFLKQWHYKMKMATCKDPLNINGFQLEFPTNTYYPPGVICAKEYQRLFCPTSGESGSPLMVRNGQSMKRYEAHGILSFIKGCDRFIFSRVNRNPDQKRFILVQSTSNPAVYTKLSCFLPWIAQQYNLGYTQSLTMNQDPACSIGTGDITDVTDPAGDPNMTCRGIRGFTPLSGIITDQELPCLFPVYLDGRLLNECVQFNVENLNYPLFACLTRNLTIKFEDTGINSVSSASFSQILSTGFCEDKSAQQPGDLLPPLNPFIRNYSSSERGSPGLTCHNNCPGGNY